jgi:hypothetical protein
LTEAAADIAKRCLAGQRSADGGIRQVCAGPGKAGAIGAAPTVINAIVDALHRHHGARHLDMPATPRRVWEAIGATTKQFARIVRIGRVVAAARRGVSDFAAHRPSGHDRQQQGAGVFDSDR